MWSYVTVYKFIKMDFFIFKLFVMNIFHPVNGAPLPPNDPWQPATFTSAIVLMDLGVHGAFISIQSAP
jgi:hypothetical protein